MMKALRVIVKFFVSLILFLAAFVPGMYWGKNIPNVELIYAVNVIILASFVVFSPIAGWIFGKKLKTMNVRQVLDLRDDRLARMQNNSSRERCRFYIAWIIAVAYLVIVAILSLSLGFLIGSVHQRMSAMHLFPIYTLYGIVGIVFKRSHRPDFSSALKEADFPLLYESVRKAAGETLHKQRLHIFISDGVVEEECNVGIAQIGRDLWLTIGTVLLCTLSRQELEVILHHEFAHIRNEDNLELTRYNRFMERLSGADDDILSYVLNLMLRFPISLLAYEGMFYFTLSSIQKEAAADRCAAESDENSVVAGAQAKSSAFALYIYEQEPYENIFRPENMPQHFATDRAMAYRQALLDRSADWKMLLQRELPAKVATHPTFRQRWEALGSCEFDMIPADLDCAYGAECLAAAVLADKERASFPQEKYAQIRQERYLSFEKIISDFEASESDLPAEELRPVMEAYYIVGKPEKMEQLCDTIIQRYSQMGTTAHARYWKGLLMLRRYDPAGLAYVYEAVEYNRNYIEDGLEAIGKFCTIMGLEEELEEYRRRSPELMQSKMDWQSEGITAKANLSVETLPEGWLEKILDHIISHADGEVSQVYLVHEDTGKCAYSAFVLRFQENTPAEKQEEIYDSTFRLLDGWPEDWEFYLHAYEPSMEKVLQRVEGSCVYTHKSDLKLS